MEGEKNIRRTYCKPQIKRVNLIVEEAVLAGCKIQAENGPQVKCNTGGSKQCMTPGTS